jgi:hypothetical protein
MLADGKAIVEIKTVDSLSVIHEAQLTAELRDRPRAGSPPSEMQMRASAPNLCPSAVDFRVTSLG